MRARIHRGAHEVGGNCIELEHDGQRLVLDLGMPITVAQGTDVPPPAVAGLAGGGEGLLGVVLSHPHPDHFGLVGKAAPSVPIYTGEAAARILDVASFYSPIGARLRPAGFLRHRQAMTIGPFTITPRLNDHSAFDAYSMEIEAGGRRLFYSGDIRGHGRKRGIFEELLRDPPRALDVLLMEGTHVRADSDGSERGPTGWRQLLFPLVLPHHRMLPGILTETAPAPRAASTGSGWRTRVDEPRACATL